MNPELATWLDDREAGDVVWFIKRLSANETGQTGAHQVGIYCPKMMMFEIFPILNKPDCENPRFGLDFLVESHRDRRSVHAIWYNNKLRYGTRDEVRITRLGGAGSSLLDPRNTGALTLFAFRNAPDRPICYVWICRNGDEEDYIENLWGPIDPGSYVSSLAGTKPSEGDCWLREIPDVWLTEFPSTKDIFCMALELRRAKDRRLGVDRLLVERRKCEFQLFQSIEEAVELPNIRNGFSSIGQFWPHAQRILQRRKSRSGKSLERHFGQLLDETGFVKNRDYSYQAVTEGGRKPDFLFPSISAYRDASYPEEKLRILAVKTSCRERWQQILAEAKRIPTKHLLTLQEGLSEKQFTEMQNAGLRLVVPSSLHRKFPNSVRPSLITVSGFLRDIQYLSCP